MIFGTETKIFGTESTMLSTENYIFGTENTIFGTEAPPPGSIYFQFMCKFGAFVGPSLCMFFGDQISQQAKAWV